MEARRTQAVQRGLQSVESRFQALYRRAETRARGVAEDSTVTRGLREAFDRPGEGLDGRPERLLRYVADVPLEETAGTDRAGVEIYAHDGRLLAWTGVHLPRALPRDSLRALDGPQAAIAEDGDVRTALVVWWPVWGEGGRRLGTVRVLDVLRYQPPVQNRYIQGFSIEAEWARQTGKPITVSWGTPGSWGAPGPSSGQRPRLDLATPDGRVLGRVSTERPPPERVLASATSRYDELMVGWAALLILGGSLGAWGGYARLATRPGIGRTGVGIRGVTLRFVGAAGLWIGARYALLALDVPARWRAGAGPLDTLFDPVHLASTIGGGVMRSTGDLLITGLFAVVFAAGLFHLGAQFRLRAGSLTELAERLDSYPVRLPSSTLFLGTLGAITGTVLGLVFLLASFVRRAVLDSTLNFFSRTGLLPEPLVLGVLGALFLLAVAAVLIAVGFTWIGTRLLLRVRPVSWARGMPTVSVVLVVALAVAGVYLGTGAASLAPVPVTVLFLAVVATAACVGAIGRGGDLDQLTLRSLLPYVFALTLLVYPMLYAGMDAQRRRHMGEAAASFEAGRDPRVLFSLRQILESARADLAGRDAPGAGATKAGATKAGATKAGATKAGATKAGATGAGARTGGGGAGAVDGEGVEAVAARLVRRSLLASLTAYEATLVVFREGPEGGPAPVLHRHTTASGRDQPRTLPPVDRAAFDALRPEALAGGGPVVRQLQTDRLYQRPAANRFQYAGLVALGEARGRAGDADEGPGWLLVRVEPRSLLPGTAAGVPRVLLPDGSFSDLYADLSLAEFRDGRLVRSLGRSFGRNRLPAAVASGLRNERALWRTASEQGNDYLTYYRRVAAGPPGADPSSAGGTDAAVSAVAVRIPAVLAFDHLYYILRLTVAGACVGAVLYLLGLYARYRRGRLPAPRVRFRDKVLNAFLSVGVVSMVAVGVVGVQVVTGENERVIERRLHDHLNRIEEALVLEAAPDEPVYEAALRVNVDSLAAQVGLDLHLYRDGRLVGTSRPRLVRDRLIDERLPARVYRTLYDETYRFTAARAAIGRFTYRVGYQALSDDAGRPRVVLAVPTLAQQERIEEEQARTLAYLFGALLLLVMVVMLTALLLANALARPIAQLREGLEAVGEGRFTRVLPVDTRDEIGDLVQTFNEMRDQLAESRRKLAQQERELAWREMARQVAHEIKNPLTPMKLSIQHLRRAFEQERAQAGGAISERFTDGFDRITSTLIEQIEALARIANEFSSFARLPTRVPEPLDLNEVIREAVRLMREEAEEADDVTIECDLHDAPLVVEADHEELRRIYINLMKNAIQAIPDHREGRVVLRTGPMPGEGDAAPAARSTITDNGTGIPPDVREKIFQPSFSTKTSGTGLGLAIAKKTIEELDGTIGFETAEGEGTTFWIRLPLHEEAGVEA
jgi:signal transduction histidine kinase